MKRGFSELDELERIVASSDEYIKGDPESLVGRHTTHLKRSEMLSGAQNSAQMYMQPATREGSTLPRSAVTQPRPVRRARFDNFPEEQKPQEDVRPEDQKADEATQRVALLWVDEQEMADVRFDTSALITYVLWFLSWNNRPDPRIPACVEHTEFMRVVDGFFEQWGPPMNLSITEVVEKKGGSYQVCNTAEYEARQAMVKETLLNMARRGILRICSRKPKASPSVAYAPTVHKGSVEPVYEIDAGIAMRMQQDLTTDDWASRERPLWKLHWFTTQMMLGLVEHKSRSAVQEERGEKGTEDDGAKMSDWDRQLSMAIKEAEEHRRLSEKEMAKGPMPTHPKSQKPASPPVAETQQDKEPADLPESAAAQQFQSLEAKLKEMQQALDSMKAQRPPPSEGLPPGDDGDDENEVTPMDFFDD